MDFDFSDDQQALRDAVRRWVDKGFAFERRHALAKAGGASRAVWAELAELGIAGLVIAPDHGGLGLGAVEAMLVAEELGRGLVPVPFAEAGVMAPLLLGHAGPDVQSRWLPRIASGESLVVPALQERAARYRLAQVRTSATRQGDGWVLTGTKNVVPAGAEADAFIVPARVSGAEDDESGVGLFLVDASALATRPKGYPTQDGASAAELMLAATPATLISADGFEALEAAHDALIAAQAAEAVGLMDRLVAVTVDYMNTRKQFGVAIASFQALRHRMADVKMALELARSMSWFATLKLGEPRAGRRRAIAQARVQLGRSMRLVGQECVQMHGGIGVTDEYIASHLFKRLTMLEFSGGDTLHHLGEVSARMTDTAGVFS